MDYEQKYNETLERAKKLKETCDSTAVIGWCEYIFPELKESEDDNLTNPEEERLRHWETIRQQTAIAVMQGLLSNPEVTTDNIENDTYRDCLVYRAIQTADVLVKKLKGE